MVKSTKTAAWNERGEHDGRFGSQNTVYDVRFTQMLLLFRAEGRRPRGVKTGGNEPLQPAPLCSAAGSRSRGAAAPEAVAHGQASAQAAEATTGGTNQ